VLAYWAASKTARGCDELVDFFLRYVEKAGCRDLLLLLVGRRTLPIPDHPQILSTGYVSEYLKQQLLRRPTS